MSDQLPNAPLTEVVFEVRWAIPKAMPGLGSDPGYGSLFDALSKFAGGHDFNRTIDLHPPYTGLEGAISRRYYRGEGDFPLLQIGLGVFAANESSAYEWETFKKMAADAACSVLGAYPKFAEFALNVILMELRYINTFDQAALDAKDTLSFLNDSTNLTISLPPLWRSSKLSSEGRARIMLDNDLAMPRGATFHTDISSANRGGLPIVRMETKVRSKHDNVVSSGTSKAMRRYILSWLDEAHQITSPAFRDIVKESVIDRFR